MLVKSVVCELTDLPPICIGSFPSTNNRSLNLLNHIWDIFRQKALSIPQTHPGAHRGATAAQGEPMACTWPAFRRPRDSGRRRKTEPKGSLIHSAGNKSFISNKDANFPKQLSTCHFTNITLQVTETTSNYDGSRDLEPRRRHKLSTARENPTWNGESEEGCVSVHLRETFTSKN